MRHPASLANAGSALLVSGHEILSGLVGTRRMEAAGA